MARRQLYLGRHSGPIGYDMRTGLKVPLEDLVEDGEKGLIRTTAINADQQHPHKVIAPPPPDHLDRQPISPGLRSQGVTLKIGNLVDTDTWESQALGSLGLGHNAAGVTIS